jgi:GPI ethanolamine phosphate transferase 2/3 subunit F
MYSYNNPNLVLEMVVRLVAILVEFGASTLAVYAVAFLFGAYLLEDASQTLIFSSLMSLLCVMPAALLVEHKNLFELLQRLLVWRECNSALEHLCSSVAIYAIIGAWLGAFVIPLDWDRWWQQWPLPCCFGALGGASLGLVANSLRKFRAKLHL